MAFTSFDQLFLGAGPAIVVTKTRVAQDVGPLTSTFGMGGNPAPVAFAPGVNGVALSYTGAQGEIPLPNPLPGVDRKLVRAVVTNSFNYDYWLCDRLWHNSGLNVTTVTEQVIAPPAIPARDMNGANLGEGVWAALEVDTAATNAALIANCTIRFTNSVGTANLVANCSTGIPATANARSFLIFNMGVAGSTGVRSIQGITLGTSLLTGAINLVLFRPLVMFGDTGPPSAPPNAMRFSALMLNAPSIPNDAVLFLVDSNANVGVATHQVALTFAQA